VYILPTRHGLTFAAMLLVMLLGSVNYNNSLGFVLTFLLASAVLVSILHTWRNLAGLTVRTGKVRPAFAGGEARFGIRLDNGGQPARHTLTVRYPLRPRAPPREQQLLHVSVAADETRSLDLVVPAERRGLLPLGRVTLATRWPLGLFRAWSYVDLPLEALVYPAPAGSRSLPASAAVLAADGGRRGPGSDDFSGFRGYQPGDSPRQIHWKAVARDQGVPVKLFEGGGAADLELRWEDTAGGVEARLSQLCAWAVQADRDGRRFGLALPGRRIAPEGGEIHLRRCLRALALFGSGAGESDGV